MSCPSTFGQGAHHCQIADARHYDLHKDGPVRWSDVQEDKEVKAA